MPGMVVRLPGMARLLGFKEPLPESRRSIVRREMSAVYRANVSDVQPKYWESKKLMV
ncbi:hypothetical protein J6590_035883 [Homalodisca vitripennis]|nr:hypothetical protein J6590_035883 [Homalodisca vitripennis]